MSIMTAISEHPNLKPWEAWAVRKFEWSASWVEAMLYTAEKQPAAFFATCARLLPNDVRVTVE